ncbi:protein MRP-126-like [Trachemys scripta elegans]|uniref:protein MRP-126-like n=1 Tax=Trachemys scripta elegans TaxID=31138 RepID=UPI0015575F53|nr:protein MRP-126-like [Trachemys scripta elegans]
MNQSTQQTIKGDLSELEKAIETIINIFHQYSVRVGHFDTLTKSELKQLIDKQLVNFLKRQRDQASIDNLFKDLDKNRDQQVSFGEFMVLITRVTIATHEHIHQGEGGQQQHQH